MGSLHNPTDPGVVPAGSISHEEMEALARGSILRGNSSNVVEALVAKTTGRMLVGDGLDLGSVAISGDLVMGSTGVAYAQDIGFRAHGCIIFGGNPTDGETVTISDGDAITRVYEFDDDVSITGDVLVDIKANPMLTAAALASAIDDDATAIWGATTSGANDTDVMIHADDVGTVGNSFTLAEATAQVGVSGGTLSGGRNAGTRRVVTWEYVISANEATGGAGTTNDRLTFITGLSAIVSVMVQRRTSAGLIEQANVDGVTVSGGTVILKEGTDAWVAEDILSFVVVGS